METKADPFIIFLCKLKQFQPKFIGLWSTTVVQSFCIRELLLIFWDLATLLLQSSNWHLYRKLEIFGFLSTQSVFWHTSAICVVYSNLKDSSRKKKMELNREHFFAIIFYNFRCGLTQQQCIDELNSIFGNEKLHQGPVFINGMVNSTEVIVYSKMNFVKVVQNQLLFRQPLVLCANWYCKIVISPIVRLWQP